MIENERFQSSAKGRCRLCFFQFSWQLVPHSRCGGRKCSIRRFPVCPWDDVVSVTCLENLEMSGNLTAVREMSRILLKVREVSGKKSCWEKWPKTVHC